MATQQGLILLTGTLQDTTYYIQDGKYLARKKSSLNRERFLNDPAFEGSRRIAAQTKITAPIAAEVYWQLTPEERKKTSIGKIIGEAGRLLRKGLSENEIRKGLAQTFM